MAYRPYTEDDILEIAPRMKETLLRTKDEGEAIDLLGDVRDVEKHLASLRHTAQAEFQSGQSGGRWMMTIPEPREKSYNTPRLINKFAKAWGATIFDTLIQLIKDDVVRLEWGYKKLLAHAERYDITLAMAQHEIVEGDDADIGTYPGKGYPTYKAL